MGAPSGGRTQNLLIKSQVLWPIELKARTGWRLCQGTPSLLLGLCLVSELKEPPLRAAPQEDLGCPARIYEGPPMGPY
jgi:hypothetical protein